MLPVINRSECTGCGICIEDCPSGALSLDSDGISVIDDNLCTSCGNCVSACPAEAIAEN